MCCDHFTLDLIHNIDRQISHFLHPVRGIHTRLDERRLLYWLGLLLLEIMDLLLQSGVLVLQHDDFLFQLFDLFDVFALETGRFQRVAEFGQTREHALPLVHLVFEAEVVRELFLGWTDRVCLSNGSFTTAKHHALVRSAKRSLSTSHARFALVFSLT